VPPSEADAHAASDRSLDRLREVLESTCSWPGEYTFKFVVPRASASHLIALLGDLPYSERPSRTGKYLAVTVCARMDSSAAVIDLYRRAAEVKGLLSF
jgi:hypothetical protein